MRQTVDAVTTYLIGWMTARHGINSRAGVVMHIQTLLGWPGFSSAASPRNSVSLTVSMMHAPPVVFRTAQPQRTYRTV